MYDIDKIKHRQIQYAIKHKKERPLLLKMIKDAGIDLSKKQKENILIFGDIRGANFLKDQYNEDLPNEFTDREILMELSD